MSDEATTPEVEEGVLSGGTEEKADTAAEDKGLLSGEGEEKDQADNTGNEQDADSKDEEKPEAKEDVKNAPEKYEAFTIPDGFNFNEEALTEYNELAKELDLSQENAQKLVDYQVKLIQKQRQDLDDYAKKEAATWKAETQKAFSKEEIADAVRGFKSAPQEVQNMLAACGFDNNKSFVEFFMHVGKSIKEDKFETGKPSAGGEKSAASTLYPELN